jgi:serine/threonine-protein kinase
MALLQEGDVIRDTHEVERFLGEGAFAEVYRVHHRFLGRQAMKVFKRAGMDIDQIHDLLGEATLLSRLGHPNIVRVFDANVLEVAGCKRGYFTMEHVAGGTLDKFWGSHRHEFVGLETAVDLMRQVCRGLAQAHQEKPPIIHRDIKPQNVLVGYEADGLRARVSDFGLARQVNPLTLLATSAGTLAFKPPEAFANPKHDSCAADVWALGTTLYLLLTDRLPFPLPLQRDWSAGNRFARPITPPSQINPEANAKLDRIVLTALKMHPKDRYTNARDMLEALEGWKPGNNDTTVFSKPAAAESAKTALGRPLPQSQTEGKTLVERAFGARNAGRLAEAADLMEEAFNQAPELRAKHARQVKLWRCGISM